MNNDINFIRKIMYLFLVIKLLKNEMIGILALIIFLIQKKFNFLKNFILGYGHEKFKEAMEKYQRMWHEKE